MCSYSLLIRAIKLFTLFVLWQREQDLVLTTPTEDDKMFLKELYKRLETILQNHVRDYVLRQVKGPYKYDVTQLLVRFSVSWSIDGG
jgi:hypothetical protein